MLRPISRRHVQFAAPAVAIFGSAYAASLAGLVPDPAGVLLPALALAFAAGARDGGPKAPWARFALARRRRPPKY